MIKSSQELSESSNKEGARKAQERRQRESSSWNNLSNLCHVQVQNTYEKEGHKNPARWIGLVANFGHSYSKLQRNTRWIYPWLPCFQAQRLNFTPNFNLLWATKQPPEKPDLSSAFLVTPSPSLTVAIRLKSFLGSLSSKALWFPIAVPPPSHFSRSDLTL